ncbi:hypothetical protein QYM36_005522 [Artemia franciscana]|uniref:SEC63 domain-containing protein n=1 Tax=Artemia franciscana TaxID=6661 RepID=A0AA88LE57_ARTSF|nr:hypothetical protein QYM36_005522 [Artemia franciscana]
MQKPQLTANAVKDLMEGKQLTAVILQVLSTNKVGKRYRAFISDGTYSIPWLSNANVQLATQLNGLLTSRQLEDYSIVRVNYSIVNPVNNYGEEETRLVILEDLEILKRGSEVGGIVGDPVQWTPGASQAASKPQAPAPPIDALSGIVEKALLDLETTSCISIGEDNQTINTAVLGRIASDYYLSHLTVELFKDKLSSNSSWQDLLKILSDVHEYAELPVRDNEDEQNAELAKLCPYKVNQHTLDSPHTKAHLLFQAHFSRLSLPSSFYHTDTKFVLDQAIRILQAMLDVAADRGWLETALNIQQLVQMVIQGRWLFSNDPLHTSVLILPHLDLPHIPALKRICNTNHTPSLLELIFSVGGKMEKLSKELSDDLEPTKMEEVFDALVSLLLVPLEVTLDGLVPDTSCISNRPVELNSRLLDSDWLQVVCNQEYTVNIKVSQIPTTFKRRNDRRYAFAPKFPEPKEEGWCFVLGSVEQKELWALKRSGPLWWAKSTQQLSFAVPSNPGRFRFPSFNQIV